MKLKNLYIALIGLLGITLAACSDDDDYKRATVSGSQVYFSSELASTIEVSKSTNTVEIPLNRVDTKGALDVALVVTDAEGSCYNFPTSASFADGASETTISVTYNPNDVVYGEYYPITLAIKDSTLTSAYGLQSYSFNIGATEWVSMSGRATYREDLITAFWPAENLVYEVSIEQSVVTPGKYRLVNAYGKAYPYNKDGDYDTTQDWYMTIHAENPNAVWVEYEETGMDWGYGNITVGSYVGYVIANNPGLTAEALYAQYPEYFGTLANGVITMPAGTMKTTLPDYGSDYSNASGLFAVALPGYAIADYSATPSYEGKLEDPDENIYILGHVDLGDDVASANVGLVAAEALDNDYLAALVSGEADPMETITESSDVRFVANKLEEGDYQIVVVTFDAEGNAQEAYATNTFAFSASASDWEAIFVGSYYYSVFLAADDQGTPVPMTHTLYQSKSDPTQFRIAKWFPYPSGATGVDFLFTFDANGNVTVGDCSTGYTSSNDVTFYVCDASKIQFDEGEEVPEPGSYDEEEGSYKFAVAYYGSNGYLYATGNEEFVITDEAAKARLSQAKKAAQQKARVKSSVQKKQDVKTLQKQVKRNYRLNAKF